MAGTFEYLCPELLLNEGYDKKYDIWCLGVLCYEMLVGYSPFGPPEVEENRTIRENILNIVYTIPSNVNGKAEDLIRKILIKRPDERLELNQIMTHPWIKQYADKDEVYMIYAEHDKL
jgi:serine/threonine protein kinase